MRIQSCEFVSGFELFTGLQLLWDEFAESDPDFSWGSNNRSLVTAKSILDHLDNSNIENEKQMETLRKRVKVIGGDMYVDLES